MKTLFHRVAAIAAGSLVGLTGLMAIASPASAAGTTTVTGSAECVTAKSEWVISWTVGNGDPNYAAVSNLTATPATLPVPVSADGNQLKNGYSLFPAQRKEGNPPSRETFTTTAPGGTASASISFVTLAGKNKDTDNTASVQLGDCKPAQEPCKTADELRFKHTFAVADGKATATVALKDGQTLCEGASEPVSLVTYFAPKPQFSVPQYLFDSATATITNENRSVELSADLPACNVQADLFFGGEGDIIPEITEGGKRYNDTKLGSNAGTGGRSEGPDGWFNGGSKACQSPAVEPLSSCDGSITVNLSNTGELSRYPVDFTVKAGEFSRTVTVAPGKGDTVEVPAGSGTVTVTADGLDTVTYDWERPADCPQPSLTVENDCKTVTVTVTNPEGVTPATATVTYGGESKSLTVAPGESGNVTFPAGEATEATVVFEGQKPATIAVEAKECGENGGGTPSPSPSASASASATASPSPSTTPSGDGSTGGNAGGDDTEGGLPVTGAAAGGIAAGAVALLVAGGVLFFLARRRKVKFTA
ncbi:cell wall anchor protein [Actinoplanes sp. NPDC051494]|uniref:cell wall anchor protein n=1 Tax=Actinoplanes sp. NPDC051494 TaxID=3363907 RepID=UPI0037A19415